MRRRWRGRRGGRSRTCVVLRVLCIRIQQHMACQRAARLVMVISLPAHLLALLRSAWLLCFLPPCSPSPPHDGGGDKKKNNRGRRGQPCASRTISTQMCALNAEWWMQQGVAHTRTRTHSWRASLLPHHSTKMGCGDSHGESVWWWWCGPLAGMQGVVAMVSCTAAQHGFHLCHATTRMRGNRGREGEGVSV